MKFIAIIPARYASTRFPGKPLVDMRGKAMIQRVYEQVSACVDTVYVATDDSRIYEAVERFGGRVVMTSENHRSGTDRCWEAYERIGGHEEVVINVQGDEPFIQPRQIQDIMNCFDDQSTQIATLVKPFSEADGRLLCSIPILRKSFSTIAMRQCISAVLSYPICVIILRANG